MCTAGQEAITTRADVLKARVHGDGDVGGPLPYSVTAVALLSRSALSLCSAVSNSMRQSLHAIQRVDASCSGTQVSVHTRRVVPIAIPFIAALGWYARL